MDPALQLLPTPAGLAFAAIAVVLGAPLFSDGLRAVRLRRRLRELRCEPLTASTDGFTHARGRVALESPLFAPLSGAACAGFRLDVAAEGRPVRRSLEVRRPFRLVDGDAAARVPAGAGRWRCEETASRRIAAGEPLSENLRTLLARVPEVVWLRRSGAAIVVTERALLAGRECHVVGVARSTAALAYASALELERTGTDDIAAAVTGADEAESLAALAAGTPGGPGDAPPVSFSSGEHLDFLLVSDRAPGPGLLSVSPLRAAGVVLGPALSLAGIFYLAAVADAMRAVGRM